VVGGRFSHPKPGRSGKTVPLGVNDLAFLLDVDNTLLDNDRLKEDLAKTIQGIVGERASQEFWAIYESVRAEEQVVDIPTTVAHFAKDRPDVPIDRVQAAVDAIDFAAYVYPGAFETLTYLGELGPTIIVSDGDHVFQRRKIEQSGLAEAVGGRVILTVHKQSELGRVFEAFPAGHYALIDDKASIIAGVGRRYPQRVTTVLVCQGKYARLDAHPRPDLVVGHIADVARVPRAEFFLTEPSGRAASSE